MWVYVLTLYLTYVRSEVVITNSDPVTLKDFSISDYITTCGYPFELHSNLQTEDGYLLDLHRIPFGKNDQFKDNNKSVVLLMHGLLGSSENFVILGCERGLAFMLADNGYDVWMGNARGSAHSRKHIRMDPDKDANFWNFSWHEIALFDVAGKVNYIRSYTKEQKLFYVGHSQGTTVYFVLNSLRPEYNDYFHAMAALAPIAFLSTKKNEHFVNHFVENGIKKLVSEVGMGELKPSKDRAFCIDLGQLSGLCSNIIHLMNFKPEEIEVDVYGRSEQTFPAGGSVKQFLHYAQEYISGRFCQYDHGSEENLKLYGNKDPPSYSIKKISSPIGIYCGVDDILSTPKNVEKLEEKLPNISNKLFLDNFTHFDFLISTDAVDLLYIPIIEEFKKINPL